MRKIYKLKDNKRIMNGKILILIFGIILSLSFISSVEPAFTFKQNDNINITLQVLNQDNSPVTETTDCYLTIKDKNLVTLKDYELMTYTSNGFFTLYIGDVIYKLGSYSTILNCNDGTNSLSSNFYFEVTPSGSSGSSNIVFIIFMILIIYGIGFFGFFGKNMTISILGGLAMLGLGVYMINQGIIIYRDDITTILSYTTIGIGAFFAVVPIVEWIEENI